MNESPLAIGIDFGGTSIKMGLVRGKTVLKKGPIIKTQEAGRPDQLIDLIARDVRLFQGECDEVSAVGVGLPGLIDVDQGMVHILSNVRGWREIQLSKQLSEKIGLPVAIENDANAMGYGEYLFGAGHGVDSLIALTLGTGVGAAVIINGQLIRGGSMSAGELGQTSIDWRGVHANYGNLGALEKYVGNHQIAERAAKAYSAAGQQRSLETCSPHHLSQWADEGDAIANRIWMETGDMIGAALANAAWLVNPTRFVIGGGVSKAGDLIFDPIRKSFESRVSPVIADNTEIVPAQLGTDAGMIGCAALGLEKAGCSAH